MIRPRMLPDMPPPAPRPFRLRAVDFAARFLLLFGGIWLTVGFVITIVFTVAGGPFWDDILLDRRGAKANAAVGFMEPTHSTINGRRVHRVHYGFVDGNGIERRGSGQTTDPAAFYRPQVSIDYDPRWPQRSRLTGEPSSLFGLFVLLPLAFAAVGAVVFWLGLRRLRAARAIYVHGEPARAEVTAVAPTAMTLNRRRVMRIEYAFHTIAGRFTGSTTSVDPPPVGSKLWVLHDASEPKRSVAV